MNSSTIANHIPAEMAALPQWVCADAAKIPHSPRSGNRASPTNPTDWATLEVAAPAATRRGHWLGFCLTAGDPVVVIDIDACRDPGTGVIDPKATALLERFPTAYVEISASGTGLHVIGTMTRPLPVHGRRAGHLEIYWASRYILMTGHVLPGHEHLGDVTEAVHDLYLETFPPASARQPQSARTAPLPGATLEDDDLLARARSARDGGTFAALFDRGDTGDYDGDDSRADLALCNRLAFWFGRDPERVDRVFRRSALMRPKWDSRRGAQTYGEITVAKAVADCRETYTAPARPTVRPNTQDASLPPETVDGLPDDLTALKLIVLDLRAEVADLRGQVDDERRARLAAEERADRSARLQSVTMAALRSRNLGNEKHLAVATAFDLAAKLGGIDTEPEPDAAFAVPLARLGDQIGASEHTVSAGLKKLDRLNLFDRQVRWVPERVNPETGELTGGHKGTFLTPKVSPLEMLRVIASAPPDPITGKKNGHGGRRVACPDHPNAGTVKRWKLHCRDCDRLLEQGEEHIRPETPATESGQNHQDGTLVDGDDVTEVTVAERDQTANSTNGVVDHYSLALFGQSPPTIMLAGAPAPNGRTPVPKPHGEPGFDRYTRAGARQ